METTNTNYRQLMLTDSGELTLEQKQFVDLHKRICYDSQKATEYIVDMAQGIREMKESKRYQTAGFTSFGEYTETALGIKERQAYNYIAVIEKLPEGFVKANAEIGVTKLALLTSVNEEEREEILEKIDITTAKTTEINTAVKEAIAAREEAEKTVISVIGRKGGGRTREREIKPRIRENRQRPQIRKIPPKRVIERKRNAGKEVRGTGSVKAYGSLST